MVPIPRRRGGVGCYRVSAAVQQTPLDLVSETFICENGAINTSRKGYKLYNGGKEPVVVTTSYDITKDAVDDFVDGARNGRLENAAFTAAESTLTGIMGREAIYSGKEKTWEMMQA